MIPFEQIDRSIIKCQQLNASFPSHLIMKNCFFSTTCTKLILQLFISIHIMELSELTITIESI
jgi:hypothetical protein